MSEAEIRKQTDERIEQLRSRAAGFHRVLCGDVIWLIDQLTAEREKNRQLTELLASKETKP
jgi:hypothetical protein